MLGGGGGGQPRLLISPGDRVKAVVTLKFSCRCRDLVVRGMIAVPARCQSIQKAVNQLASKSVMVNNVVQSPALCGLYACTSLLRPFLLTRLQEKLQHDSIKRHAMGRRCSIQSFAG